MGQEIEISPVDPHVVQLLKGVEQPPTGRATVARAPGYVAESLARGILAKGSDDGESSFERLHEVATSLFHGRLLHGRYSSFERYDLT
jgi:hypothetical protein